MNLRNRSRREPALWVCLWLTASCESPADFDDAHQRVAPNDCATCHAPDYTAAKTPLHRGADRDLYPRQCDSCHERAAWAPAHFAHSFPLDGQHALSACGQCHAGNPPLFAGTPRACVACHQRDFERSTFPGHSSFPTSCGDCHVTSSFASATGPHPESVFPIQSGVHHFPCADCHDASRGRNSAANTDCVGCHVGVHSRAQLDPIHQQLGVVGYPTGPAAPNFCLLCHPSGSR